MKYLIIFFFCAITLGIIYADDENGKSNPTTFPTEQDTQPAFPYFQNTAMSIPKVVYLKNLFEMNCLKEILDNNRLKNRSVSNQEKRDFIVIPNLKNNGNRPSNSNKRYTNAGVNKNNPMQDKFLLIPSRLGTKYVNFQSKKEINSPKYPLENQKRIIYIRNHGEPTKTLNKKEIPKNKEIQKISLPVFPQIGLDKEAIKKQEKVVEDVTKLTNKGINKFSNPTTPNNPRIGSNYKNRVTTKPPSIHSFEVEEVGSNYKNRVTTRPPSIHSYEVEEVIQEDINVDVNKKNEGNIQNEKVVNNQPLKPSMDDIKTNIFEIINKLLNSDFESNVKESEDDSKVNKKSKLDEKLWKELTKKQSPPEKPFPQIPNMRYENPGGNKENKNFYQDIKNEKLGRREKPNNPRLPPQILPNITLNNRKIQATPRVQVPGIYAPKIRQNFTNVLPPPKLQVMNTKSNLSNFVTSQLLNGRRGKIEKVNVQNMNTNSPTAIAKTKQESIKMKESEKSNTKNLMTSPSSKTFPTSPSTTEKITSSFSSGSSATSTLIQSVKFFSKTTVKTPEVSSQETTDNPVTINVLEETTEIQTKKEDALKNSRKMNFGTGYEELENSQEQRRSDILIEDEVENGIRAMEYINKLKNTSGDISYDSLSAKTLSAIVPLVIDDIRKEKILPEDVKVLSEIFGKYWSFIQDLSYDINFDMMSLLKIKDKKDFEELFESYNSKENEKGEENRDKTISDNYDYVEEYKEMYKDLLLQELGDTGKKLRTKRDEDDDLKALEATREYFESVQEEENEIDYLYEDIYSDAVNRNKEEDLNELISLMDFLLNSKNSSKNIFNL